MEVLLQHFPSDIANMIDNMKSHSEHYDQLKDCFIPMQIKVLLRQFYRIDVKMYHRNQHELDRIYCESFPDLQISLELLSQCRCCHIHQECKPTTTHNLKESDYRVNCAILKNEPKRELKCFCPCRHYARRLTRAHLYSMFEHEEDNRYILHEVFLHTHNKLREELSVLSNLKKEKKKWLQKMNNIYDDDDYVSKYKEYQCNYYEVMDKIEIQEGNIHECEDKDTEITHLLENHILDFPGIVTSHDAIFKDMFIYPAYDNIYDTDMYDSEDIEMIDVDV